MHPTHVILVCIAVETPPPRTHIEQAGCDTGFPLSLAWTFAAIFLLVLACYWPALHGSLVWDDSAHVTRPELTSLHGLWRIWTDLHATQQYYPLLHSAFWLEHRLWGPATIGYHLVNVLLHAADACLLVVVLRRLAVPGAALAGLIFAVHPVCVESVAWISEQKNTLSLAFYLLSALAYLGYRSRGKDAGGGCYALALFLFVMALLTKSVTATLPAALLVVFWWRNGRLSWRDDVIPLVPWFVVALASGLFTIWVEKTVIGAEGASFDLTLADRGLLAGRIIWFYVGKLVWPVNLMFVYPHWNAGALAGGWIKYLAAVLAVTAILLVFARRSRGPLAAWLFFVGSLFPALGFFNVYPFLFSYVADHFQYIACIGIFAGAAAMVARMFRRPSPASRASGWVASAAIIATLAVLSNLQSRVYADEPALYKATLALNPESWMAHNNLGVWYQAGGNSGSAIAEYGEALRLRPDYFDAHNNLGSVLLKEPGHAAEAAGQFQAAIAIKPASADAHDSLGNALSVVPGRLDEAVVEYRRALELRPGFAEAHNNLGSALMRMPGHLEEAEKEYCRAIELNPESADAHNNLGNALCAEGRRVDAVAEYREALRIMPGYGAVHFNIAMALLNEPGRRPEAASELREFLKSDPGNAEAARILAEISP
jgi:tetratricopeptide (TPR) repeat protein